MSSPRSGGFDPVRPASRARAANKRHSLRCARWSLTVHSPGSGGGESSLSASSSCSRSRAAATVASNRCLIPLGFMAPTLALGRAELQRLLGEGQPALLGRDHEPFLHDLAVVARIEALALSFGHELVHALPRQLDDEMITRCEHGKDPAANF